MPGTKITDHQVRKFKEMRMRATQEIAAAKTGISVRSARRVEQATGLPSQRPPRSWRKRADPLAGVWDEEVVPLLESQPRPGGARPSQFGAAGMKWPALEYTKLTPV